MFSASLLSFVAFYLGAPTHSHSASAFQPCFLPVTKSRTLHTTTSKIDLLPGIHDSILHPVSKVPPTTSIILSLEVESWRQYVPLVVSCLVIIDILLGSPLANLALGPMRRASEKGATGDSAQSDDGDDGGNLGGSLFSAFAGGSESGNSGPGSSRGKERVDSEAIAQAALDKAMGTLELNKFLEENKTDEQRYEEVRKKIDQQMSELDD